jgi:hypothetical protein
VIASESVTGRGESAEAEVLDPLKNAAGARGKAQAKQRGGIGIVGAGDDVLLEAA